LGGVRILAQQHLLREETLTFGPPTFISTRRR
jgi:hypothetical protein